MSQMNQDRDPNTGKGIFIAIGLCVVFYLGWSQYLSSKYPGYKKPLEPTDSTESVAPSNSPVPGEPNIPAATTSSSPNAQELSAPALPQMPATELTLSTADMTIVMDQAIGSIKSVKLNKYREDNEPGSPSVDLLHEPLIVKASLNAATPLKASEFAYSADRQGSKYVFSRNEGNWKITNEWLLPESGYAGKLAVKWTNLSTVPQVLAPAVVFEMGTHKSKIKSSFFAPGSPDENSRFLTQSDGSDDFHVMENFCSDQTTEVVVKNKKLDFFGFDHHYFAAAFVPTISADYRTSFLKQMGEVCKIATVVSVNLGSITPGETTSMMWDMWLGPKDVELLTAFNPHLRTTLGLGWLDMIAHPLLLSIKGLHKFSGNYGIAIILLTLLLKIIFYPLAKQAAVSAAKMKKLNPEMTKLKEKYKAEPQRMQMELMKFMSQNKINPMKGCLPILPTIPVFFALFRVLSASIDLRHAPFFGWILDLSAKDPYFVTPIILTGCMFVQQKMTPMTGMDPTQEKIMTYMPLIFGVMMISLPSGLVLYMLTNTVVSIAQQQYLNKKLAAAD